MTNNIHVFLEQISINTYQNVKSLNDRGVFYPELIVIGNKKVVNGTTSALYEFKTHKTQTVYNPST